MQEAAIAPQVSIIVPVYNVEGYLRRCLDSILAQTLKEWECICVDDGSTDGCGAILDEYAARDGCFVVIHQENMGLASARNSGLDAARAEYIGFVDSDDWIEPETYEIALETARGTGADIVQWRIAVERESGPPVLTSEMPKFFSGFAACESSCGIQVMPKLFKAGFLAKNGLRFLPGVRFAEDFYFSIMAYGLCKKGAFISRAFYHYDTTRQTSLCHTSVQARMQESEEARKSKIEAVKQIERMLKEERVANIAGGGK